VATAGGKCTCIEATVRFAAELGYEVTVVKDATADYSDEEMHAALDVNIPNYASAVVTAAEIVDSKRDSFRSCPERRLEPTFPCEGADNTSRRSFGQQTQCLMQVRFPRTVGPLNDIQLSQWDRNAPQRTIIFDGKRLEHGAANSFILVSQQFSG
jgi:hypothetical protein